MNIYKEYDKNLVVSVANCLVSKAGISAEKYLESTTCAGATDAIKALAGAFKHIYLVYKTSKDTNMERIASWLKENKILKDLNLDNEDVIFVSDAPKMQVVLDKLFITHLVHDDLYIANKFTGLDHVVVIDTKPNAPKLTPDEKKYMTIVSSWEQAQSKLEEDIKTIEV